MNGSAVPNGLLDDAKVRKAWALYISKWVASYEAKGLPVWAVSPQVSAVPSPLTCYRCNGGLYRAIAL